jgi:hypothetical protein
MNCGENTTDILWKHVTGVVVDVFCRTFRLTVAAPPPPGTAAAGRFEDMAAFFVTAKEAGGSGGGGVAAVLVGDYGGDG